VGEIGSQGKFRLASQMLRGKGACRVSALVRHPFSCF
jgi:hypothetical protein